MKTQPTAEFGPNPGNHRDDCAFILRRVNCSCEYPRYVEAVESIAQDYVSTVVDHALDEDLFGWEDWPDLPEFVWEDVRKRARLLTEHHYKRESTAAYRALSSLATEDA